MDHLAAVAYEPHARGGALHPPGLPQPERVGIGSVFLSERFNVKEAASLTGAAAAVTTTLGIATGVTNHNTRHPLVTAAWGATVHRLSGGRFALNMVMGWVPPEMEMFGSEQREHDERYAFGQEWLDFVNKQIGRAHV